MNERITITGKVFVHKPQPTLPAVTAIVEAGSKAKTDDPET